MYVSFVTIVGIRSVCLQITTYHKTSLGRLTDLLLSVPCALRYLVDRPPVPVKCHSAVSAETSAVHVISLLADDFKFLSHNSKIMAETKMLLSGAAADKESVRLPSVETLLTYSYSFLRHLALPFISLVTF